MTTPLVPTRVWDAPIRLFHWSLVVLIFLAWLSQRQGWMQIHFLVGYTILALLLFRLVWGVIGSDTARFSRFLRSPVAAFRYLGRVHRRGPDTEIGHNAAGGWMVLVMLVLLAVQVVTGLCANDDIMLEGPLAHRVGKADSDWLTHIHGLNFTLIELAILLHVLAILAYAAVKRHDLVRPMVTGRKRLPTGAAAPRMVSPLLALVVLVVAAGAVALLVNLAG